MNDENEIGMTNEELEDAIEYARKMAYPGMPNGEIFTEHLKRLLDVQYMRARVEIEVVK